MSIVVATLYVDNLIIVKVSFLSNSLMNMC